MPRSKKPYGTAVDKRNGNRLVIDVTKRMVDPFPPPPNSTPSVQRAWDAYWEDRASYLLTPASKAVLTRWADAMNRYELLLAEADKEPLVYGVSSNVRPNPLYSITSQMADVITRCERQLGIGTYNATSLGLAAVAEQRSVAEMNAQYEGSQAREDADTPLPQGVKTLSAEVEADVDPRLLP